jgi:hypothetical protein
VAAHRLGQVEAYLTVRQVLSEASRVADDVLLLERSGFYQCRYVTLELIPPLVDFVQTQPFEIFDEFHQIADHQIPNSPAFVTTCFCGITEDTFR